LRVVAERLLIGGGDARGPGGTGRSSLERWGMSENDEAELLAVAQAAARAAAGELLPRFGHRQHGVRSKSTPTDLVSDADVSAEAAIRAVLTRERPRDAVLGEEGGSTGEGELRWIVDPLDGTINFLYGIPAFAISVACEDASGQIAGVVLDPLREECFAATRSGPATLNGQTIEASKGDDLATAMVATGFGYAADVRARQAEVVSRLLPRVRDVRRVGAAALDLAWCACGRFDAYYERGVHQWDVAAGTLIAARAGMQVRELPADGDDTWGIVVAGEGLMDELFGLVGG
jgi:myo-inositol-1(or 4)-monophosphatase